MVVELSYDGECLILSTSDVQPFERFPISAVMERLEFRPDSNGIYRCCTNIVNATVMIVELLGRRNIEVQQDKSVDSLLHAYEEELEVIARARLDGTTSKRAFEPAEAPALPGFRRTLYTYQMRALNHAISIKNPANFSVPGSGKTTLSYAYFQYLKNSGIVDKMLVICPISAFRVWEEEYDSCIDSGLNSGVVRINGSQRHALYGDPNYEVYITNFHLVPRDNQLLRQHLTKTGRYFVVVDEAHYVKNPGDGIIKSALLDIASYAARRMIATGTPCPNSLMDLHSQFAFLWPSEGVTGSKHAFGKLVEEAPVDQVKDVVFPFFYRIQKKELQLPPQTMHNIHVTMGDVQRRIYEAIRDRAIQHLRRLDRNDIKLRSWRRAWVIRINQVMSNPSLLADSNDDFEPEYLPPLDDHVVELAEKYHTYELPSKFLKCMEILRDLYESDVKKVVVWTNFKKNVSQLNQILSELGWRVHVVTGDVSNNEQDCDGRDQVIERFRITDKPAVLLATPASCAESISLHKHCHHMIFVDLTFNAVHWMQAKDRIHRIGMDPHVSTNYYVLLTSNSYDDEIYKRILDKEQRMELLLDNDFPLPGIDLENDISIEGLLSDDDDFFKEIDEELEAWRRFIDE